MDQATKDWLLFLGPLFGVVVGGLITGVVKSLELRSSRKAGRETLILGRVEEMVALSTRLVTRTYRFRDEMLFAIDNNAPKAKREDLIHTWKEEYYELSHRFQGLADMYLPMDSPPDLEEIAEKARHYVDICRAYGTTTSRKDVADGVLKVGDAITAFQNLRFEPPIRAILMKQGLIARVVGTLKRSKS